LQRLELTGDGGLRQMQGASRATDVQVLGDMAKGNQLLRGHGISNSLIIILTDSNYKK
jgi:hypothetical protein